MKIYSVKDTITGVYMHPFYQKNDAQAKRSFSTATNSPEANDLARYWENTELYCLGEWNDETGEIKTGIYYICKGADVKVGV